MPVTAQSALLKREIEAKLAMRIPGALSPIPPQAPRLMSCGVPRIDGLLGGGVPLGGITEFSGLPGSGRTSLAFAVLAEATGETACAYIDVHDDADPRCLASAGVDLNNLLWVRFVGRAGKTGAQPVPPSSATGLDPRSLAGQRYGHHPRTESKGMDVALANMVKEKAERRSRKQEGTPGYPNRSLGLADATEEQIRFDRLTARKPDASDPIRRADRLAADEARRIQPLTFAPSVAANAEQPWTRLDRAIRATDQILQSGGFRAVVLDLASTPPEHVLRIPSATWFRFRRAAQESDAVFLLLTQVPCARSSASCVLDCTSEGGAIGEAVLESLFYSAEIARQRQGHTFGKKAPGRAASWEATPAWMRASGR